MNPDKLGYNPEAESKYKILHERGVELKDSDIELIISELAAGARDTQEFLGNLEDSELNFISSDNLDKIGYVPDQQTINVPLPYFKSIESLNIDLLEYKQKIGEIQGQNLGEVDYQIYLRNAGREEAVHHYQNVGHEKLKAKLREEVNSLSDLDRLLCDVEVEARRVVDEIAISKGEEPIWEKLDQTLQELFPERYNMPIESLTKVL